MNGGTLPYEASCGGAGELYPPLFDSLRDHLNGIDSALESIEVMMSRVEI